MQIKEFASKYKLKKDAVRYYEKEGLIEPTRLANGYRIYDETCEKSIKYILVLKQLGFSLQEIQALLNLEKRPPSSECNAMSVTLFKNKVSYLESKIDFYTTAIKSLQIVHDLMEHEKYVENKDKVYSLVEEMYRKIEEGDEHNVTS
ncbi:MarR family transcriptional regulator [Anaerobacillus alkalidiazotrophicus]|uniref:MarR family transcriptional regulator n=1 Tax=Anaerobacillus alkalidiazotrophicus TaxID=472963 RepID=A0A1S2M6N4_9BACI|nr:MerR family transcriptional regulator [Anaerobacillus alkalidiazotrophicus]OIJ20173.1 MarR family transcriptional regulator [Anaerobacillus alkalidiazotrophicus]